MEVELIGIREASRRMGISDTAVHKAIKAGRVAIAGRTDSGRPLVAWPTLRDDWSRNTDQAQQRKPPPALRGANSASVGTNEPVTENPNPAPSPNPPRTVSLDDVPQPTASGVPSYAQSQAIQKAYQARLAKLDFEERLGKLISVDQVKADAYRTARQVRDAIMNIPDRVSMELAHETDASRIHEKLAGELRTALEQLAGAGQ